MYKFSMRASICFRCNVFWSQKRRSRAWHTSQNIMPRRSRMWQHIWPSVETSSWPQTTETVSFVLLTLESTSSQKIHHSLKRNVRPCVSNIHKIIGRLFCFTTATGREQIRMGRLIGRRSNCCMAYHTAHRCSGKFCDHGDRLNAKQKVEKGRMLRNRYCTSSGQMSSENRLFTFRVVQKKLAILQAVGANIHRNTVHISHSFCSF